ncbi:MAG TPA: DUF5668 domain-containing protein [Candidatus Aminicenantes bacterium]|nr:DUF5668 domain-containing protein [Candidatus Aminicenantes bacterium]
MAEHARGHSLVWGVILIVVGALFLLDQLNVDVWDAVWRFWPVILIVWGANKLWLGLKERSGGSAGPGPDKGHEN